MEEVMGVTSEARLSKTDFHLALLLSLVLLPCCSDEAAVL